MSPVRERLLNKLLHDAFCVRQFTIFYSSRQLPCEKVIHVLQELPLSLMLFLIHLIAGKVVTSQDTNVLLSILHKIIALFRCKFHSKYQKLLLANIVGWIDVGEVDRTLLEHFAKITQDWRNVTKDVDGAHFLCFHKLL